MTDEETTGTPTVEAAEDKVEAIEEKIEEAKYDPKADIEALRTELRESKADLAKTVRAAVRDAMKPGKAVDAPEPKTKEEKKPTEKPAAPEEGTAPASARGYGSQRWFG